MSMIHDGPFLQAELSANERYLWVTRTSRTDREIEPYRTELAALERVLTVLPMSQMRLVLDLRTAPGRNDAAFESDIVPRFFQMCAPFVGVGVLVRTEVGKLQARRIATDLTEPTRVFSDEAEARRFAEMR